MSVLLPDLIAEIGDAAFAAEFDLPVRTVQSWRRRERLPRPELAREIISRMGGRINFDGIYGMPANDNTAPAESSGAVEGAR